MLLRSRDKALFQTASLCRRLITLLSIQGRLLMSLIFVFGTCSTHAMNRSCQHCQSLSTLIIQSTEEMCFIQSVPRVIKIGLLVAVDQACFSGRFGLQIKSNNTSEHTFMNIHRVCNHSACGYFSCWFWIHYEV